MAKRLEYAGMNDTLQDAEGNPKQVFSYFLPTWGLPYVLSPNATTADKSSTTVGDWAMIKDHSRISGAVPGWVS